MNTDLRDIFPKEFTKIKNLGYDSIERRKLSANLDSGFHAHPFKACMIILEGEILLNNVSEEFFLNKGDFISVDNNVSHNEKIGPKGAIILYGKKFNENKNNLAIIEDSLNALYLGGNNKLISFITKSPASYILYLTLYKQHYSEIWKSQEDILHLIPKIYASRSTIINLINDGIKRNFINKKRTNSDKRSVYYELNQDIFYEIESWIKERKSKLINILQVT
ncbi:cupin domain-containing protein [Alphaproteobacteria bacterium]|nr:cupin domain-containing protein [Alphaproteobacteria bacterium]